MAMQVSGSGNAAIPRACGVALLTALAAQAPAALAQDADAQGRAEVVLPATLTALEGLDFGPIVGSATGGAMTVNPSTNASSTVGTIVQVGTSAHRATFRSQLPTGLVIFFLGDPSVTLTRQGGSETMTASLTYSTGAGLGPGPFLGTRISTATDQFYYAGGTLFVAAGQAPGLYEGVFNFGIDNL